VKASTAEPYQYFPTPYWTAAKPLALAFLHGTSYRLTAGASAKAWAGLGTDALDETGATIGAGASGSIGGTLTRLAEPAPRHYYPYPSDSTLREDVDDLFSDGLTGKVAAWLIETGGGVGDLQALGVPRVPLEERAALDAAEAGAVAESGLLTMLKGYDVMAIPDIDTVAVTEVGLSVIKALKDAMNAIKAAMTKKKLQPADLLQQLDGVRKELGNWVKYLEDPAARWIYGRSTRAAMLEIAQLRLAEAKDFSEALKRLTERGTRASTPAPVPTAETRSPRFHLDIVDVEMKGQVSAAAKAVVGGQPLISFQGVGAYAAVGAEARSRRISLRYQSFVPGAARRTLISSQETVIDYSSRRMSFEAAAGKLRERKPFLVTMSYRSVLANWFDDAFDHHHQAIPNGSGVCFGMSILREDFGAYARACKMMKKPPPGTPVLADLDEKLKALETVLTRQLRVEPEELRAFVRRAPSSDSQVDSYLIESAFAFTAPVDLVIAEHRPKALLDLNPVKQLVEKRTRGAALRLQVMRLRIRMGRDEDQSRNLIRLGWNPEPWSEEGVKPWGIGSGDETKSLLVRATGVDPTLPNWLKVSSLAIEFGIALERVRRTGADGSFDFYSQLYPEPYDPETYGLDRAEKLKAANLRGIADMVVPPVALFSQ
jgi:hypothetical protein